MRYKVKFWYVFAIFISQVSEHLVVVVIFGQDLKEWTEQIEMEFQKEATKRSEEEVCLSSSGNCLEASLVLQS